MTIITKFTCNGCGAATTITGSDVSEPPAGWGAYELEVDAAAIVTWHWCPNCVDERANQFRRPPAGAASEADRNAAL